MTGKEWAMPIVLGLVAAGGLWALAAGSDGGGEDDGGSAGHSTGSVSGTTTAQATPPILLPFFDGNGRDGAPLTFLVLAPLGQAAAQAELNGTAAEGQTLVWQSGSVALYSRPAPFCSEPAPGIDQPCDPAMFSRWPLPKTWQGEGPGLLRDGYNATKVTAYVFDEAGLLLGSNANDTARFTKHDDYFRLPSSAWYLGANETAPDGTAHLPGFAKPLVDRVRPQLDGLPQGGVASVRSNAYVALYGSLFVTIRVDELVHAP